MYAVNFLLASAAVPILVALAGSVMVAMLLARHRLVGALLVVAVVLFVLWATCVRQGTQIRVRAAAYDTRAPRLRDLSNALLSLPVVGGGWSFFLQKRGVPQGRALLTHRMRGRIAGDRWGAGTTIGEVQATLAKEGRSLTGHPSVLTGTLGGWIFTGSHGSGGTLWKRCIGTVRVWDRMQNRAYDADPRELFCDAKTVDAQRRWVILEVELRPVADVLTQRSIFRVRDDADAEAFLKTPSYLRMLQVGARGTLALLWTPPTTTACPSARLTQSKQYGLWLQSDVLTIFQGATDSASWFDWPTPSACAMEATLRLGAANHFTPTPPHLLTCIGLAFTNFEVFVHLPTLAPRALRLLCEDLAQFFQEHRGRCELRYGASGKLFLDFILSNTALEPEPLFQLIASHIGHATRVALHKGKAQVSTLPLLRVE